MPAYVGGARQHPKAQTSAYEGLLWKWCVVCAPYGVEILFGVSAKQCRDHHRKSFPPPKALRNPKVEFAKSRSRFGHYIRWSDMTKVL